MKELAFIDKVQLIFSHPKAFFKRVKEEKGLEAALKTYVYAIAIATIIGAIPLLLTNFTNSLLLVGANFVAATISIFISAAIVHLFVMLFKGKGGYAQTFKVIAYAAVPAALINMFITFLFNTFDGTIDNLLIIPQFIIFLYVIVLEIKGLRIIQKLTTLHAFLSIIIPIAIVVVIIGYLLNTPFIGDLI